MAAFVVDTSVLIGNLIEGNDSVAAFFSAITAEDELIIPEFALLECANVIWKQVRFRDMERQQAFNLLTGLHHMALKRVEVKSVLDNALTIALKHDLAVYDAAFIALCASLGYPLITLDDRQSQAAAAEKVRLIPLSNFQA